MPAANGETYDVVVVGGGAAGLSAALVLGRAKRRLVVVDAGAPRNAPASHMHGYLSRDGMPPAELLAAGRREATSYGVELFQDSVTEIETGFSVRLASGRVLQARRVLLATGAYDGFPHIPGAQERWGRDFLHCPYCHGWEVRDEPLGVLGTQAASVEHAHLIRQWSDDVVFFSHTEELSDLDRQALQARGIRIVDGRVARLVVEEDRLVGVALDDGNVIARTAVFVRPTILPHPDGLLGDWMPHRRIWIRNGRCRLAHEHDRRVGGGKRGRSARASDHCSGSWIGCRDLDQRRSGRGRRPERARDLAVE